MLLIVCLSALQNKNRLTVSPLKKRLFAVGKLTAILSSAIPTFRGLDDRIGYNSLGLLQDTGRFCGTAMGELSKVNARVDKCGQGVSVVGAQQNVPL
jgi:hypothetical protein